MDHPHSILVIDDDEDSRDAMTECMRIQGAADARGASDGADGMLQLLTGLLPCMILLDMRMGGVDGTEFLRRKALDATVCLIPVIVISGTVWPILGAVVASLLKPIDVSELAALITQYCSAAT